LDKFPQIAKADVKRNFPNTLNLIVNKKQAVGVFVFDDNNFYIDKQGIIFKKEKWIYPENLY